MKITRVSKSSSNPIVEQAGWLFADLMLVLAVVGFASATSHSMPKSQMSHSHSVSPPSKPHQKRLSPKAIVLDDVHVDGAGLLADRTYAIKQLQRQLSNSSIGRANTHKEVAGLIMVFAGPTDLGSCQGNTLLSKKVYRTMRQTFPNMVKSGTVDRPFISTNCAKRNKVSIEMYVYR